MVGVQNIKETSATAETITLKWSKLTGVSGYQIYRSASKSESFIKVATIKSATEATYKDSELVAGKTYYYKIRAYVKSGNEIHYGAFSKMLSAITKPNKVADLEYTVTDKCSVIFTWSAVPGATKYNIYYATSKNGKYKLAGTTTTTSYDYFTLSSDTYYFKVAAVKSAKSYEAIGSYSNALRCSDIWGMTTMVAGANFTHEKYGYTTYTIFDANEVYDKVISTITEKVQNNNFLLDDDSDILCFYCPLDTDITVFQNARNEYDAMFGKEVTTDNYGSYYSAYETNVETLFNQNFDDFFHKKAVNVVFGATSFELYKLIQVKLFTYSTGEEYLQAEAKANEIAASFTGDVYSEVKFAYDYLINNAAYDYSERDDYGSNPHAHSAYGALIEKLCVCDGYAEAFYLMMKVYGIPCNIVVNKDHAWNEVMIDGKWYVIDATNHLFLFGQDIMKATTDITFTDFGDTYIWETYRVAYFGYASSGNSTKVTLSETSYVNRQVTPYWGSGYYYSSRLAS
jgi:hypothetical protein